MIANGVSFSFSWLPASLQPIISLKILSLVIATQCHVKVTLNLMRTMSSIGIYWRLPWVARYRSFSDCFFLAWIFLLNEPIGRETQFKVFQSQLDCVLRLKGVFFLIFHSFCCEYSKSNVKMMKRSQSIQLFTLYAEWIERYQSDHTGTII